MKPHNLMKLTRWRGRDLTLSEIAREVGLPLYNIRNRYVDGKRGEALTEPVRQLRRRT